jgi:aldose 1-epimerase
MPEVIALRAGDAEASIVPGIGANCTSFRVAGHELLEPPTSLDDLAAHPNGYGCPILFPFPGQLVPGTYRLLDRDVQIVANSGSGRHGHGFASARPWRVLDRTGDSCTCRLEGGGGDEYPWRFRLTARWRVTPGLLGVGIVVENLDHVPMPFGLGLHPYIAVGPDTAIELLAAAERAHAGGIPSRQLTAAVGPWSWRDLEPGGSTLLTDLPPGDVEARVGAALLRWPSDRFGEVVLYRPPERASVCVEPWSSVSNAAAQIEVGGRGGLMALAPEGSWRAWLEITAPPSPGASG